MENGRANEPLRAGDILAGRYRIRSVVGKGGMGTVYLADDGKLPGKQWAVKASLRHARDPRGFEEEACLLAGLDHPFLPKIADFFPPDEEGFSYLVTDYIRGENLQEKFERSRPSVRNIVRYAVQLCDLFAYLHGYQPRPIIYRDLKPSNVMIDDQDNVRLVDFGIARSHSASGTSDTVCLGTVGFAAPEQFGPGQTDARTDLYTLGAMMYYLLSGGQYYDDGREALHRINPLCPEGLSGILDKLLQPSPDDRFQTAGELKGELERYLLPENPFGPAAGNSGKGRRNRGSSGEPVPYGPRKLVVVGGLYPGAGASFFTMALCRALHAAGISNAMVEYSTAEPELYALLFGERYAPTDMAFTDELILGAGIDRTNWCSGLTRWIPLHPSAECTQRLPEHGFRLLRALGQEVAVLDVSTHWSHEGIIDLCRAADFIVAVGGPEPARLSGAGCRAATARLAGWEREGKPVIIAANRDGAFAGKREWLKVLPLLPEIFLPIIPSEDVAESQWKGKPVPDHPSHRARLQAAMRHLVDLLYPGRIPSRAGFRSLFRSVGR